MSHQMTVMMTQNITRCHLKNQAGARFAKRTPNAAAKLFSFNYFKACLFFLYGVPSGLSYTFHIQINLKTKHP